MQQRAAAAAAAAAVAAKQQQQSSTPVREASEGPTTSTGAQESAGPKVEYANKVGQTCACKVGRLCPKVAAKKVGWGEARLRVQSVRNPTGTVSAQSCSCSQCTIPRHAFRMEGMPLAFPSSSHTTRAVRAQPASLCFCWARVPVWRGSTVMSRVLGCPSCCECGVHVCLCECARTCVHVYVSMCVCVCACPRVWPGSLLRP